MVNDCRNCVQFDNTIGCCNALEFQGKKYKIKDYKTAGICRLFKGVDKVNEPVYLFK